jgi:hypothetical protein
MVGTWRHPPAHPPAHQPTSPPAHQPTHQHPPAPAHLPTQVPAGLHLIQAGQAQELSLQRARHLRRCAARAPPPPNPYPQTPAAQAAAPALCTAPAAAARPLSSPQGWRAWEASSAGPERRSWCRRRRRRRCAALRRWPQQGPGRRAAGDRDALGARGRPRRARQRPAGQAAAGRAAAAARAGVRAPPAAGAGEPPPGGLQGRCCRGLQGLCRARWRCCRGLAGPMPGPLALLPGTCGLAAAAAGAAAGGLQGPGSLRCTLPAWSRRCARAAAEAGWNHPAAPSACHDPALTPPALPCHACLCSPGTPSAPASRCRSTSLPPGCQRSTARSCWCAAGLAGLAVAWLLPGCGLAGWCGAACRCRTVCSLLPANLAPVARLRPACL